MVWYCKYCNKGKSFTYKEGKIYCDECGVEEGCDILIELDTAPQIVSMHIRNYDGCCWSDNDLEYRLKGVDFMLYYYNDDCYAGWGECILHKNGKWYIHGLSHCSCYGPLEDIDWDDGIKDLVDINGKITGTYLKEVLPLIDWIKENRSDLLS